MIYLLLSISLYAISNIIDRFACAGLIKSLSGYLIVIGICNLIAASIVFLMFGESFSINHQTYYVLLAGICSGVCAICYYYAISKRSASETLGLLFFYPILLALMAWHFLGEQVSTISWAGILVSITGAILLSKVTFKHAVKELILAIVVMVTLQATMEIFIKLSSDKISSLTGAATMLSISGVLLLSMAINPIKRRAAIGEIKIIPYAFMGSAISLLALSALFSALELMPANQVAGLSCLQPVVVLLLDSLFHKIRPDIFSPITWDKTPAILMVALGSSMVVLGAGNH